MFADESAVDGLLWALADRLGSIRDWADYDAGTDTTSVYDHVILDSFGNINSQSNPSHKITIAFTGRYRDPATGLQWNRARWYDPGTGRWLSEDPIGFAGGDVNLHRYVGNSPSNFVDPSGLDEKTNHRWHHMLVQAHRADFENAFRNTDLTIDDARFGWLMTNEDHVAITPLWGEEWDDFFDKYPDATEKQVLGKLKRMKRNPDFVGYLEHGVKATCSHQAWGNLSGNGKTGLFNDLRKSAKLIGGVMGGVLAVGAAADKANAAFAPVLALGDAEARREYRTALSAIQRGRFDVAENALFGEYARQGPAVIFGKNPQGVIPKMLSRMVDADPLARDAAISAIAASWGKWCELSR